MMFQHIKRSIEFREVLAKGRKVRGKNLELFKLQKEQDNPAVGIIISKKFSPKATQRNYVRRLIYGFFREQKNNEGNVNNFVVRINSSIKGFKKGHLSKEIRSELFQVLQKAGK